MKLGDKVSIVAHDGSVQPAKLTRMQPSDGGFGAALGDGNGLGGDRWFLLVDEGKTWVHGHAGPGVEALRTVAALSCDTLPDDDVLDPGDSDTGWRKN